VTPIESPVTGSVWKLTSNVGDGVKAGDQLLILESMKMEFPVEAPHDGVIEGIDVAEGDSVTAGEVLARLAR
jgi:biotin carboxyl carrier protein